MLHIYRQITALEQHIRHEVQQHPGAQLLLTHPGVGPLTALATEVFLGDPARFADGSCAGHAHRLSYRPNGGRMTVP